MARKSSNRLLIYTSHPIRASSTNWAIYGLTKRNFFWVGIQAVITDQMAEHFIPVVTMDHTTEDHTLGDIMHQIIIHPDHHLPTIIIQLNINRRAGPVITRGLSSMSTIIITRINTINDLATVIIAIKTVTTADIPVIIEIPMITKILLTTMIIPITGMGTTETPAPIHQILRVIHVFKMASPETAKTKPQNLNNLVEKLLFAIGRNATSWNRWKLLASG